MPAEDPGFAEWTSVFTAARRRSCEEQALVLKAMGISHLLVELPPQGWHLLVPETLAARAREELYLYHRENPRHSPPAWPVIPRARGLPLAATWVLALVLAWIVQRGWLFGVDWLGAGGMVAGRALEGEWWRALTALMLHADIGHLVGNLVFGAFFAYFAGQHLGSGVAALAIIVFAGFGNLGNAWIQLDSHRSIGASTAVFAALGLIGALAVAATRRHAVGWARSWAPVVGAVAMLAFIGTGDEHTDIVAHLTGFVAGMGGGVLLQRHGGGVWADPRWQPPAAVAALCLLGVAWWLALR